MSDDKRNLTQDEHDLMMQALLDSGEKIADIPHRRADAMSDEDEMTEEHVVRTEEEYQRVTKQEKRDEELARAKAAASGLIGLAAALKGLMP